MKEKTKKEIVKDGQLYQLTTLVAGDFSLQEVLDKLAEAAVNIVGVKACSIRLLDPESGELRMRSTFGLSEAYRNKGPVDRDDPVIKDAFSGKAIVIDDMNEDRRVRYKKATVQEGLVSQLTVAMEFKGKPIGVLRLYSPKPKWFSEEDITMARSVASQCAVAITNARFYSQAIQGQRIKEQMRLAGVIQRRMIPANAPKVEGLDIAAKYIPCFDVGGDFYDFIPIDEKKFAVVIADVIGKGIPAALMTSTFRGAVRAYTDTECCKDNILSTINKLNSTACRECQLGEFVTLFYGIFDVEEGTLTYCNCGHEPTILIRSGKFAELDKGGLVLGIEKDAEYEVGKIRLNKNDSFIFYTDGLIDAANFDGELWGRERLLALMKELKDLRAELMIKSLLGYRRRFVGLARQIDDTSLIIVKVDGKGTGKK